MTTIITLIPAYRTDFLPELLFGLSCQTYKDFKVVISDDSPEASVTELLKSGRLSPVARDLDITLVQGPRRGGFHNIHSLIHRWSQHAELVHLLMDDDIVFPDFYRHHALVHETSEVQASVSLRWFCGADGRPYGMQRLPEHIEADPRRAVPLVAADLFPQLVPNCENWLGEFSNCVLSRSAVRALQRSRLHRMSYYGLDDIGLLLDVSRKGPIMLIREHLGGFRMHAAQSTAQTASFGLKCGYLAWAALSLDAWGCGALTPQDAVRGLSRALALFMRQYPNDEITARFLDLVETHATDLAALSLAFEVFWAELLQRQSISASPVVTIAEGQPAISVT
jgi:hypothetical protein